MRCQRCERYICVACQFMASVGYHCPECVLGRKPTAGTVNPISARLRLRRLRRARRNIPPRPMLTGTLVAANCVMYLLQMIDQRTIWNVSPSIRELMFGEGVFAEGATWGQPIARYGEWWRLFSGAFLHANLLHVGFNVLLLWLLGRELEVMLGSSRFGLIYLTSVLAGSFGALLHAPNAPTVGASGGVFGLMGSAIVVQKASGGRIRDSGILGLLILNLITTFTISNISVGGHIGGLLGGALASWALFRHRQFATGRFTAARFALVVGLIAVLIFAGLAMAGRWADPVFG